MAGRDKYYDKLAEIADCMENIYQLSCQNQLGVCYSKLEIDIVMEYANRCTRMLSQGQLHERNTQAGKQAVLLSYITVRLSFFCKYEFSFDNYPYLGQIAEILLKFVDKSTIGVSSIRDANRIVAIMKELDVKYVKFRFSLPYRYLRLFLIMVVHKNFLNASVIARLLLSQMIAEEGICEG